ncbi:hypothetical protein [Bacteroides sp. 51]|uniref:hypothetical protein n=1 Tax=Bacteroides sp. 51 TaxID=2302938 RepID=UPI0013D2F89D|nr:hypothetical protein [Bacteroides sp. 51]NDV83438.1 hypothetical protein [Bacteroides sp. 51]
MMGNIEFVETAYQGTKQYIVYDSFHTIMIAIVLFLSFLKLYDEWQKNITTNDNRFKLSTYWGTIRVYVVVCIIASFSGQIFTLTESICCDLQTALVNDFGTDVSDKATQMMTDLVREESTRIAEEFLQGNPFDMGARMLELVVLGPITGIVMALGVAIFKHVYTFFILGRYMWLLMLEMVAPIAIALSIHEGTRSYFYTWVKNMIVCYMLIPMFFLADRFADEVAVLTMQETLHSTTDFPILCLVVIGVWVKIKMFGTVRAKASQLF